MVQLYLNTTADSGGRVSLALSVIIAGALLFFGGATSLIFGFDIVMTERGSAMTLGGIIAMSGGVIAVGVGLCLQRLSQLLAVMDNKRSRHPTLPDRPIVPIVTADDNKKDMEPATRILPQNLALGAGLAAAAGVAGGIAVSDRHNQIEHQSNGSEVKTTHEPLVEPPTIAAEPAQIMAMPDLEAELSRALQENNEENNGPVNYADNGDPAQTFSSSLTGLLAKPSSRKRRSAAIEPSRPVENELAVDGDEGRNKTTIAIADDGLAEINPRHGVASDVLPETEVPRIFAGTEVDGASAVSLTPIALDTDHEKEPEPLVSAEEKETAENTEREPAEPVVEDAPEPGPNSNPKQPGIVGSYKVGGRSYTMFADGSVEAMTESGIQRFESMDQLRRHLAGTRA